MKDDSQVSSVELFATPALLGLEALSTALIPLVGGGIVNPFGPTLQLAALIGSLRAGTDLPIVRVMLNPFSQEIAQIGLFRARELIDPVSAIQAVIPSNAGGCPTALLVSPLLGQQLDDIVHLTACYLATCESGETTLAGVTRFPGDPRSRVKQEIDESMKRMLANRRGEHVTWPSERRLTLQEAAQLAQMQLQKSHWIEEWRGFLMCWSESIQHQQGSGIARTALSFDSIEPIFTAAVDASYATMTDTFPDWEPSPET
jgi:hypothetical protein